MNKKIKAELARLNAVTNRIFQIMEAHNKVQQHHQPTPYSWCMVQVVEHLTITESGINKLLLKNVEKGLTEQVRLKDRYRGFLIQSVLKYSLMKVKQPKSVERPQGKGSFEQWKTKWKAERRILEQIAKDFPEDKSSLVAFVHPYKASMNIAQTIAFISNHAKHHERQLKRIMKSDGFPS